MGDPTNTVKTTQSPLAFMSAKGQRLLQIYFLQITDIHHTLRNNPWKVVTSTLTHLYSLTLW